MKRTILLVLFALAVPVPGASFAQPKPQGSETPPASLAFTHVTVIDATGAAAQPDMTVVIAGDRIAALGRTNRVDLPQDARVVDAAGQFLIPGLWDMHAHIAIYASMKATRLPLLIANGVTGVRDLGALDDTVDDLRQWREEIAAGRLLGPRIVAAGPILDGREGGSEEFSIVTTAAEGRQAVVALAEQGFDFVKVYSWLTPEVYSAIVDEAGKQRLPFAGHVPRALTVAEASDAGQKSIEHLTGMLLAVSTRESELMREMAELPEPGTSNGFRASSRILAEAVESYSENKAGRLFKRLVENETWHCPTLVVLKSRVTRHDPTSRQDPRLRYICLSTRQWWDSYSQTDARPSAAELAVERKLYARRLELVGAMHEAGVGILAGTDMGNPYCFPGSGLHDELELLVEAGLTPMEALQTATFNAVRYLGMEKDAGTIAEGKLADLVLLDADPLADIGNVRKIDAVVLGGRLLDRKKLDRMLAGVEAAFDQT